MDRWVSNEMEEGTPIEDLNPQRLVSKWKVILKDAPVDRSQFGAEGGSPKPHVKAWYLTTGWEPWSLRSHLMSKWQQLRLEQQKRLVCDGTLILPPGQVSFVEPVEWLHTQNALLPHCCPPDRLSLAHDLGRISTLNVPTEEGTERNGPLFGPVTEHPSLRNNNGMWGVWGTGVGRWPCGKSCPSYAVSSTSHYSLRMLSV